MDSTLRFYQQHAAQLDQQYSSIDFEKVQQSWQSHWPRAGMSVLDVGAGNGRDSLWMAQQGCDVIAVEPTAALRAIGKHRCESSLTASGGGSAQWLNDRLPELSQVQALGLRFDLILVSAVWMHLTDPQRQRAFRKLAKLLKANGKLVITLRHGSFDDDRVAHPVSIAQIEQFAKDQALHLIDKSSLDSDFLGRNTVRWQTVILSLPDDGTGDLIKIRHIIVNDSKSATYKLALLRTLLRIADSHSGASIDRSDGQVALPLGLIALYWIKQFKRLVDDGQLQQQSNAALNLGFIKAGWHQLRHLKADDLSIGALFTGADATALQSAMTDAINTIKAGPVTFTYEHNDKSRRYFAIERKRRKTAQAIVINSEFLNSFGQFTLPESLWESLRLYHSWIEPLVVNQWINEMRGYQLNQSREQLGQINLEFYHQHLAWCSREHNTNQLKRHIERLEQQGHRISSVWSGKTLTAAQRHIDHCLPFTYWPNNDLWNLLPCSSNENLSKSAKVPSQYRLNSSKQRVLDWWVLAFSDTNLTNQFFQQAQLSLPNIPFGCQDFEAIFDALQLQVRGVKSRLLIPEW